MHFPQSIANLADGSVCPDAIDDVGHSVGFADAAVSRHNRLLGGRALEGVQPPVDFRVVAAGPQWLVRGRLALGDRFVYVDGVRLFFLYFSVLYSLNDLLSALDHA